MQSSKSIRVLTQVALLAAIAIIARSYLSPLIPGLGRINTSFIFSQLVPILFGPFAGGLSNALIDMVSYFIAWQSFGGFMIHLLAVEIFAGILIGVMWRYIKMKNRYAKLMIVILTVNIIYTVLNTWGLMYAGWLANDWLLLPPRLALAIGVAIVNVHVMFILLNVYEKYIKKEKLQ